MAQDVRVKLSAEGVAQVVQAFQTVQKAGVDATSAINDRNESEEQAAARLRDTVKASLDAQAAAEALAKSTRTATAANLDGAKADQDAIARNKAYTASYRDRLNAQKSEVASLRGVTTEIKNGASSFEQLAAQEKKAAAAFDKGAISLEEYQKLLAKLDDQHASLTNAAKKSPTQGALGGLSTTAITDAQRLVRELATGQFQSAASTTSVLAQNLGLLEAAFSPLGLAVAGGVAVIGALAAAEALGYLQAQALTKALIVTGDASGETTDQLLAAAKAVGTATGQYGKANDAVLLLAQSGKVGSDGLQQAAQAAVEYSTLTGKSIEDAVSIFNELQTDPVAAVKKLDEQLHFLTATQYEQIKAAQDQGDTERAAALAQDDAAKALQERNQKVQESLGYLERAWLSVRTAIAATIEQEKMVGSGTATSQINLIDQQITDLKRTQSGGTSLSNQDFANQLKASGSPLYDQFSGLIDKRRQITTNEALDEWVAQNAANDRKVQEAGQQASDTLDDYAKKAKGDDAKAKEIALVKKSTAEALAARPNDRAAIEAQQKEALAYIEKQYAPKGGTESTELAAEAAQLRDDLQRITTDYTTSMAQLDAARKAGTISTQEYYDQAEALLWKNEGDQVTAIQAEIARLEVRKGNAKEQIQIDQRVADLKSQLSKIETDTTSKDNVLSTQRIEALKKEQEQIESYIHALDQMASTRQDAINAQVRGVGQGSRQNDLDARIDQVNQDADNRRYGLQRDFNRGQIDKPAYDAELAALDEYQKARVQQEKDADEQLYDARKEWSNGAYAFAQDYADQAANTAQQTYSLLGTLSDGVANDFADLAVTGKASWKDLADDIIKQIIRIKVQAAEAGLLQQLFPSTPQAVSSSDNRAALLQGAQQDPNSITFATGGAVHGPGTATSDSIDAKLSDGEYVFNAAAVRHYGLAAMDSMNAMRAPRFATGGYVTPRPPQGFVPRFATGGPVIAAGGANGAPVVQVIDQRSTSQPAPEVTTSRMPNGQDLVKVLLRAAAEDMVRPGGGLNSAAKMAFGLNNTGVKRG